VCISVLDAYLRVMEREGKEKEGKEKGKKGKKGINQLPLLRD
jgi:hypothetical protein